MHQITVSLHRQSYDQLITDTLFSLFDYYSLVSGSIDYLRRCSLSEFSLEESEKGNPSFSHNFCYIINFVIVLPKMTLLVKL